MTVKRYVTTDMKVRNLCRDLIRVNATMDALKEAFGKAEIEEAKILVAIDALVFPDLSDPPKTPRTCAGVNVALEPSALPEHGQISIPPGKTLLFPPSQEEPPEEENESPA